MICFRVRLLLLLVVVVLSPRGSSAQTYNDYTWNGAGPNNLWTTSSNWSGNSPPVPGAGTSVVLNGGASTTPVPVTVTRNNFDAFTLSRLRAEDMAPGAGFTVDGNGLTFVPTSDPTAPVIEYAGGAGTRALVLNVPVTVGTGTTLNINVQSNSGSSATYEMIVNGPLLGGGSISRTDDTTGSEVAFNGPNGTFSGVFTNKNVTLLAAPNVFSRTATINLGTSSTFDNVILGSTAANQGLAQTGSAQQIGAITGTGTLQIQGATGATAAGGSTAVVGFGGASSTISTAINMNNDFSHLGKVGTGTLTLTAANGGASGTSQFRGAVSVRDGSVVVSGSGSLGTTNANPGTALAAAVYAGAELRTVTGTSTAGATANGRLQNNLATTLSGGMLHMDASGLGSSGTGYSDAAGALTIGSGESTIRIDAAAGRGAQLSFASLTQGTSTGTVFFQSGNLGTAPLNTAGSGNVNFGTAPALVGGILPYGFAADTATGSPTTFVTYDGTNLSIRGVSTYAPAFGTDADNVSLSTAPDLAADQTANSLRLTAGGSVDTKGHTLTITSGALLSNGGGDLSNGTLAFGGTTPATRTTAYVTTNNALNISSNIEAANLSKNGAGNLTLTGATTLTGSAGNVVAVNAGTLTLGPGSSVTTSNAPSATNPLTYQVSRGATLDVTANGLAVGNFTTLTGGYATTAAGIPSTVAGNVSVGGGGTIAPSSLGGGTGLASPGTLAVDGNLSLGGGSTYAWYVSSAITNGDNTAAPTAGTVSHFLSPYTSSLVTATGTLDLSGASSDSKIVLKISPLALSNAGPTTGANAIYDLNLASDTRSWVIAQAGGVSGFAADKFVIDASAFGGSGLGTYAADFSISLVGNDLVLTFSPVPEPAAVLAVSAAALALGVWRRRQRNVFVAPGANTLAGEERQAV